jgi:homoserine kinase
MIRVEIPATTANLGPGFDCMGMALDLWNSFELHLDGDGPMVENYGEGAGFLPCDESNMVVQIVRERVRELPKFRIVCRNAVPCASGLGSSSTATLAGLVFAKAIEWKRNNSTSEQSAAGYLMDHRDELLAEAVEIEGHGDNVAPAILGGLQIVYTSGREFMTRTIAVPPIRVVVCVPDFLYLTSQARAALPKTISHRDAVFNIGRAMLTVEALRTGDADLLADAMQDRLHEDFRLPDIPGAIAARRSAKTAGATAVALSGAGPGVIAFSSQNHEAIGQAMVSAFSDAGLVSRSWILDASPGMTIANL